MAKHPLEDVLHPKSVAVAGASNVGSGGRFVTALRELGFKGNIYPVHPKYKEVHGAKCYPSVSDIPGPVDHVISSIPATQVLNLLDDCAKKGVKSIHFFTARFSETGRPDAIALEKEVLRRAKKAGIRLIGPNCMGIYYPAWGLGWNLGMPKESGPIGLVSQSGAAAYDLIETAKTRGLYYSKGISYGNAIDFNECDYLEYLAQDPETKMILMYIEGVRDGKRFLDILRKTTSKKPVIILKGGRGKSGTRATASHTASLAGSAAIWKTAMKQAGAIEAVDTDEMLDVASAFYFLPPMVGNRVGVTGGTGGSSVMAADLCEEVGLDVIPLPDSIRQELKQKGSAIWDWISNPADFSISVEDFNAGELVGMMAAHPDFDMNIVFMNTPSSMPSFRPGPPPTIDEYLKRYSLDKITVKPLLVVVGERNRGRDTNATATYISTIELREKLADRHLPVYPTVARAANAAAKMINYYKNQRAFCNTGGS
jgi:acyl-CoA synthetase (NDP forming)